MSIPFYRRIKGFQDIVGEDILYWQKVEAVLKDTFELFSVEEFRIPMLEYNEVFTRGIGKTTDIVEKEMFTFTDLSGESITLRPEGTAGVVRAYIENSLYAPLALKKYYYIGSMFRREKPQKGRFRQFSQAGVEFLGSPSPLADAEVISIFCHIFKTLGVASLVHLELNSVGCSICRHEYRQMLINFFQKNIDGLCEDCIRRLNTNPLRILDCKKEVCKSYSVNAPAMLENLCPSCLIHFEAVKQNLDILGVFYEINKHMVRGLDYYMRTAFEMTTDKLGAQNAVGGGGRYDGLVKSLGGPDISGIGFAIGLDRLMELTKFASVLKPTPITAFIIFFEETKESALKILKALRESGVKAVFDADMGKLKSQMKKADASGAKYAVIVGSEELKEVSVTVRELAHSRQELVKIDNLSNFLNN